ncbi:MAG: phosphoglycerate kinase [Myxococcales bacterium]|nr:phosphoglycerate kinase [Myxococcales bacterium]
MAIKRVDELELGGKTVFCRVDFNVPLQGGKVGDDTRVRAALPTIKHLLASGAKPVLGSHLGRPKGKVVEGLRMEPVGARLAELLDGPEVIVTDEPSGDGVRKVVADAPAGAVVLLENLRFDPREKKNDDEFAKALASLADVYVNDAFGTAHRAHASTVGVAKQLSLRAAGFLMMKELEFLGRLLDDAPRPFVAVLGGAKVEGKLEVLESLVGRVDAMLIGGAMANTFLAAQGKSLGASRVEEELYDTARGLLAKASKRSVDVLLPSDVVVADGLDAASGEAASVDAVPAGKMALDIGPETLGAYAARIAAAKAVFWNGPMGVFEKQPFSAGTFGLAKAVADSGAMSVIGGGDSVAAVVQSGLADKVTHISTGGGASLEFMAGKKLPGVAALEE